jgi:hypothetical protein
MPWVKKDNYYMQNGQYTITATGIPPVFSLFHKEKFIQVFPKLMEAVAHHKVLVPNADTSIAPVQEQEARNAKYKNW